MDTAEFGRLVAACRKEKQMTQAELAGLLHVTSKAVSRWERGVGYPDITTLEPLAAALGLRPEELLACARSDAAQKAGADTAGPAQEQAVRCGFWRLFAKAAAAVAGVFFLSALAQYFVDIVLWRAGRISDYGAGLAGLGIRAARVLAAALAGLLLRRRHCDLLTQGALLRRRWTLGLAACLPAALLLFEPHSRLMRALYGVLYAGVYDLARQRPGFWLAAVLCEAFCSLDLWLCFLLCAFLVFAPVWRPKRRETRGQDGVAQP